MGLIVTFPHLDFFRSYFVTLVFSLVNLVLSLPLHRSLSTRMCSVTPSCHLVSHGLSRRNALRRCRSTKATPRVQVGQTSSRNITFHLGSAEEHTVFEAKLVGILLRLQLIRTHPTGKVSYAIGVDNQAAIKALASGLDKPGHYIAAEVLNTAARLRKTKGKKYSLTIRWTALTAGHSKIPGNEAVDAKAKKVEEGLTTSTPELPKLLKKPLKISKSAAKQRLQNHIKTRWKKEWEASPCQDKIKHIDPNLPSHKYIELISTRISNKQIHRVVICPARC
jgi:hypothetical protein